MKFTLFLSHYIAWHYSRGIRSFVLIWGNIIWFTYHFFSIPLLIRTLFSPFERLGEEYKSGLDFGAIFGTFVVNSVMRLVGAFTRGAVVLIGSVFLLLVIAFGMALFVAWLFLPFVAVTFLLLAANGLMRL